MMTTAILLAAAVGAAPVPVPRPKADGLLLVNCVNHLRFVEESGREVRRYTPPVADGWPAWQIGPVSPDLTRAVLTATLEGFDGTPIRTVIAPLDGKGRLRVIRPPGGRFAYPFWAADGKRVIDSFRTSDGVFGGGNNHCANLTFDVGTGRVGLLSLPTVEGRPPDDWVKRLELTEPNSYRRTLHQVIACAPTGGWYLTCQYEPVEDTGAPRWLALVSQDGKTVRRVFDKSHHAVSAAFAPSGARAVFTVRSRDPDSPTAPARFDGVFVMDVKDVSPKRVVASPPDFAEIGLARVAWSPDGKRIAFGYHRRTKDGEFEFRVVSYTPDGRDPRTVLTVTGTEKEVAPLYLEGWR